MLLWADCGAYVPIPWSVDFSGEATLPCRGPCLGGVHEPTNASTDGPSDGDGGSESDARSGGVWERDGHRGWGDPTWRFLGEYA